MHAIVYYKEAAKHHEAGAVEKGAHHTQVAQGRAAPRMPSIPAASRNKSFDIGASRRGYPAAAGRLPTPVTLPLPIQRRSRAMALDRTGRVLLCLVGAINRCETRSRYGPKLGPK